MSNDQLKFPRTPHVDGPISYRGDLQLLHYETDAILEQDLVVQEKVDGANVGIWFDEEADLILKNRGGLISFDDPQFNKLRNWMDIHTEELFDLLGIERALFGEWCFAQHSEYYDRLPSYFMAFDIFDFGADQFLSYKRLQRELKPTGIKHLPAIFEGKLPEPTRDELEKLIQQSSFGPNPMEGVYVRVDSNGYNESRCKLVRPGFLQQIDTHWKSLNFKANHSLDYIETYWDRGYEGPRIVETTQAPEKPQEPKKEIPKPLGRPYMQPRD
ncbi:RNA ligase family protein [Candidatus Woesearchaeota archaeon]|jgi:hypothetical protein|nr:RNA ligase family protein [Candidatus Woesearchaeota archaeon]